MFWWKLFKAANVAGVFADIRVHFNTIEVLAHAFGDPQGERLLELAFAYTIAGLRWPTKLFHAAAEMFFAVVIDVKDGDREVGGAPIEIGSFSKFERLIQFDNNHTICFHASPDFVAVDV